MTDQYEKERAWMATLLATVNDDAIELAKELYQIEKAEIDIFNKGIDFTLAYLSARNSMYLTKSNTN